MRSDFMIPYYYNGDLDTTTKQSTTAQSQTAASQCLPSSFSAPNGVTKEREKSSTSSARASNFAAERKGDYTSLQIQTTTLLTRYRGHNAGHT
jgi:hypothetical protein